jgi:hypothetical protein
MIEPWEKSENKSAVIYGRKSPGSGGGPYEKLDIIGEGKFNGWRGENKFTSKESFSITTKTLDKLFKQALQMMSTGFLIIDFGKKRYILLEENDFIDLVENEKN